MQIQSILIFQIGASVRGLYSIFRVILKNCQNIPFKLAITNAEQCRINHNEQKSKFL